MYKPEKSELVEILKRNGRGAAVFTSEDRARVLNTEILKKRISGISEEAEKYRGTKIPVLSFSSFKLYETTGDRTEFEISERGYFYRRRRLLTFALLSWLYEREEDVSELEDIMWAIMDEYTWALPAHLSRRGLKALEDQGYTVDLFAAETAHALMEAVSLLRDKLSPIVVTRAMALVKRRVLDRYDANFFWKRETNNWAAVCAGAVGMAAMYSDESDERVADVLMMSLSCMENYISGFTEDGASLEGLDYWNYGFGYFMAFSEMLYRRTGGEINLFFDEKIHRIATFCQKCFFPGGRTVAFSDASDSAKFSLGTVGMLRRLYSDIEIPEREYLALDYERSGCARFAFGVRNLVWATDALADTGAMKFGTHIFPSAEWYISTSENGVSIAAKAGNNGEPHNHNDTGSFHIYKSGSSVISDIGCGEYSLDYFDERTRYNYFCCSSAGHSVPIINGEYQKSGRGYSAADVVITENGICAELRGAYDVQGLDSLVRRIDFDRISGITTVKDSYKFKSAPESVTERFVMAQKPEIIADGTVKIPTADGFMTLLFDSEALGAEIHEFHDMDHVANERITYALDLNVKNAKASFDLEITIG